MKLTFPLNSTISFKGRKYRLNLAFDNVLRMLELQSDWLFNLAQRIVLSVELLAGRKAARLPIKEQMALFKQINDEFISTGKPTKKGEPRVLDFTQDAPLIYASFMQAYGVDLYKERGRMDWRYFIALFQGLPDNTRIREVIVIRKREVPAPTKHNAEEIKALLKAKAFYALDISEEEAEKTFQAGVDKFAESLLRRAKAGVNNV